VETGNREQGTFLPQKTLHFLKIKKAKNLSLSGFEINSASPTYKHQNSKLLFMAILSLYLEN